MNCEFSEELNGIITQMLKPLKCISFCAIIEGLSNFKVIPYDKSDNKDIELLNELTLIAQNAGEKFNLKGIKRTRPNEAGNDIEAFVKDALNEKNFKADIPLTKNGKHKSMGYPDIQFTDQFERVNYLECKTYNIKNIKTSQRSFYLSPSEDFKITQDAHHLLLSYEIDVDGRENGINIYKCKRWKLLSLENIKCDVKYEFNTNNKIMYVPGNILAEGDC